MQQPTARELAEPVPAKVPVTFTYIEREDHHPGSTPSFTAAPASQYDKYLPNTQSWQESPDPIRQSDFWAAGNKVNPWARMLTPSHLAIGSKEAVMQDNFEVGKLLGYLHAGKTQYAGAQYPSIPRVNIEPAIPATYGSQYELRSMPYPGGIIMATGMSFDDGYPY